MDNKLMYSVLEGLVFMVGDEGVGLSVLSDILEVSKEDILKVINQIQDDYQDKNHGIEMVNYGGLYKFVSKVVVHDYAKKLFTITKQNKLSPSALETLAIIAYKQPITRVEIEEIRGVGSDTMIRRLSARNLIKEVGRAQAPGLPILYGVTSDFLDVFQLLSVEELPDLPEYSGQMEMDLYEWWRKITKSNSPKWLYIAP